MITILKIEEQYYLPISYITSFTKVNRNTFVQKANEGSRDFIKLKSRIFVRSGFIVDLKLNAEKTEAEKLESLMILQEAIKLLPHSLNGEDVDVKNISFDDIDASGEDVKEKTKKKLKKAKSTDEKSDPENLEFGLKIDRFLSSITFVYSLFIILLIIQSVMQGQLISWCQKTINDFLGICLGFIINGFLLTIFVNLDKIVANKKKSNAALYGIIFFSIYIFIMDMMRMHYHDVDGVIHWVVSIMVPALLSLATFYFAYIIRELRTVKRK